MSEDLVRFARAMYMTYDAHPSIVHGFEAILPNSVAGELVSRWPELGHLIAYRDGYLWLIVPPMVAGSVASVIGRAGMH